MTRRCDLAILVLTASLLTVPSVCIADAELASADATFLFTPSAGVYLGAYIHQDPVVEGSIDAFVNLVGKPHASYMRYVGYGEPFPFQWVQEVVAHGAVPQIAWEPNNGLSEVQDDAYLRGWAEAARHAGGPILLRYASEMNGDWMPYSGDPDEYIRKWRLVYQVMHQIAPNVIMVWCPFGVPRSTIPLYYPGDDYVDWVGVNIYAVIYNNGDLAQPATDTQMDQLNFIYNLYADRKPIAICEYAATHYCQALHRATTAFARRSMRELYQALPTKFPRVVFISWFSVDAVSDRLADNNYAVTTDPAVLATYRQLISSNYFLSTPREGLIPGAAGASVSPTLLSPPGPTPPAIVPSHPLPLEGQATPGPRELAIVIYGASPRAAHGKVTLTAVVGEKIAVHTVTFYLDNQIRCLTNMKPYQWDWNTEVYEPGEHLIRVVVTASNGVDVAQKEVSVIVAPRPKPE